VDPERVDEGDGLDRPGRRRRSPRRSPRKRRKWRWNAGARRRRRRRPRSGKNAGAPAEAVLAADLIKAAAPATATAPTRPRHRPPRPRRTSVLDRAGGAADEVGANLGAQGRCRRLEVDSRSRGCTRCGRPSSSRPAPTTRRPRPTRFGSTQRLRDQPAQVQELKITETGTGAGRQGAGILQGPGLRAGPLHSSTGVTADFSKKSGTQPATPALPGISSAQ